MGEGATVEFILVLVFILVLLTLPVGFGLFLGWLAWGRRATRLEGEVAELRRSLGAPMRSGGGPAVVPPPPAASGVPSAAAAPVPQAVRASLPSAVPSGPRPDPAAEARRRETRNVNVALYAASLLLVAAAALFVGLALPGAARVVGLALVTAAFLVSGLVLHARVPRLRPAAVAFAGTGIALIPVWGVALDAVVVHDPPVSWLVTSVLGAAATVLAAVRLCSVVVAHLFGVFLVSSAMASGSALRTGLVGALLAGLALTVALTFALRRPGPDGGRVPREVRGALQRQTPWLAYGLVLSAVLFVPELGAGELGLVFAAGAAAAVVHRAAAPVRERLRHEAAGRAFLLVAVYAALTALAVPAALGNAVLVGVLLAQAGAVLVCTLPAAPSRWWDLALCAGLAWCVAVVDAGRPGDADRWPFAALLLAAGVAGTAALAAPRLPVDARRLRGPAVGLLAAVPLTGALLVGETGGLGRMLLWIGALAVAVSVVLVLARRAAALPWHRLAAHHLAAAVLVALVPVSVAAMPAGPEGVGGADRWGPGPGAWAAALMLAVGAVFLLWRPAAARTGRWERHVHAASWAAWAVGAAALAIGSSLGARPSEPWAPVLAGVALAVVAAALAWWRRPRSVVADADGRSAWSVAGVSPDTVVLGGLLAAGLACAARILAFDGGRAGLLAAAVAFLVVTVPVPAARERLERPVRAVLLSAAAVPAAWGAVEAGALLGWPPAAVGSMLTLAAPALGLMAVRRARREPAVPGGWAAPLGAAGIVLMVGAPVLRGAAAGAVGGWPLPTADALALAALALTLACAALATRRPVAAAVGAAVWTVGLGRGIAALVDAADIAWSTGGIVMATALAGAVTLGGTGRVLRRSPVAGVLSTSAWSQALLLSGAVLVAVGDASAAALVLAALTAALALVLGSHHLRGRADAGEIPGVAGRDVLGVAAFAGVVLAVVLRWRLADVAAHEAVRDAWWSGLVVVAAAAVIGVVMGSSRWIGAAAAGHSVLAVALPVVAPTMGTTGGVAQMLALAGFAVLIAVGLARSTALWVWWGAAGVAVSVMWALRGLFWLWLVLLAAGLIAFAVQRLLRSDDRRPPS